MSPLLEDGICYVHLGPRTNGAVFAFNLANGSLKWKWTGEGPSCSSPVILTMESARQLVTLTAKSLVGLSLTDGKLLWQVPFEAAQGNNTTPVISGQTVICSGQGKGMFAFKIEGKGDAFTATALWTNKAAGARFTTPVLKDGSLYGYNGHLFCASAETGATLWEDATNRGNSAALVDVGSIMLALTVNSELTAFKPSAREYAELARFKVAETETWAHPVVFGNRVLVRDRESLALWAIE
jgi:outer membrane protein assembly factor BamB